MRKAKREVWVVAAGGGGDRGTPHAGPVAMRSSDSPAYRRALAEGRVGRPCPPVSLAEVQHRRTAGEPWWQIERDTGVSRRTLQSRLAAERHAKSGR